MMPKANTGTTSWYTAMKYFKTGQDGATYGSTWTNVQYIDLPRAQSVSDAVRSDGHIIEGDNAWCFAINGRALYYDAELLKRLLPDMQNLRTIVLLLHYNLHTDVLCDSELVTHKDYYIYYNYRYLHLPDNTFPDGWLYRSAILSGQMHKENNSSTICNEFGNTFSDFYYDSNKQDDNSIYNPPHQMNVDNCIKYLTNMAKTCAEHEVRFIVVTPPFPNTWLKGCTDQGISNLTMITDSVNMLFPLEYKNYMQDSMFRNDSLYCNWNHLNRFGATLFAQRVKEDFGL